MRTTINVFGDTIGAAALDKICKGQLDGTEGHNMDERRSDGYIVSEISDPRFSGGEPNLAFDEETKF